MPEKISIVKESGETISSNIVSVFMIPDTGKKYIITTENAVDPHGLTVLHVSEIVDGTLQKVATDDEWSSIKTIMRAIISGNVVSYQYLQPMETVNAASQYSRDISVSSSASKQMVDNYNAADKTDENPTSETEGAPASEEATDNTAVADVPLQTPESESSPSIFPADGNDNSGEEVVPGISEVPVTASPEVAPVPGTTGDISVPQDPNMPIDPTMSIDPNTGMPNIQAAPPMMDPNNMMQPQVTDINSMNNINIGFNNDVQVVDPNQGVPTGQIVQDATVPSMNMMNNFQQMPINNGMNMNNMISPNVTPSFNPNASLDEVVVAAQEMFMAGVKNLVETIQEKVYRDLYAKEAELKIREEAILQKEQMYAVNPAMMGFNVGMLGMNPSMAQSMNQMMMPNSMNTMNTMNNMMPNVSVPMQQNNVMSGQTGFQQPMMMQQQMGQPMQTQPMQPQAMTASPLPQATAMPVSPQLPPIPITVPNDNV